MILQLVLASLCLQAEPAPQEPAVKPPPAAPELPKHPREIQFPEPAPFTPSRAEKIELPNGLTVYLMEDRELPFVSGFARLRVGSIYEPADKLGLAAIAGTTLRTGGSEKFPGDKLDEELARIAASIEASIGEDSGSVSFRCLKEDFAFVFERFADLLRRPSFPQGKLDLAKKEWSNAISRRNDNPGPIAAREFAKILWGAASPWARTVEHDHLAKIAREDLAAFHKSYFAPNNARLAISGDFDAAAMREAIEKALGDWERAPVSFPKIAGEPLRPEKAGAFFADKPDVNQSTILLGHEGVRRDEPDAPALRAFSYILGTGGFSSRLVQVVRSEKGFAYSVSGGFDSGFSRRGIFRSSCGTKTESTGAAIEAILAECRRLVAEGPTEDELRLAKERLLNGEIFQFDTKEKVLRRQVELDFYGLPADFYEKESARIRALTLEEVALAGKRRLDPDRLQIVVVGAAKGFEADLSKFGAVTALDISIPKPSEPATPDATPESLARGRAVISAWVEAAGGAVALQGIRSYQIKGEETRAASSEKTFKVPIEITVVLPDRLRLREEVLGTEIIQVMDASGGWAKRPAGVSPIPAAQLKGVRTGWLERSYLPLLVRAAKGEFQAQFVGTETVEGIACETVRLREESGSTMRLSFNASNHQLLRASWREGNDDVAVFFEDYRVVGPALAPHQSRKMVEGKLERTRTATSIAINPEIDEAIFARPAEKP